MYALPYCNKAWLNEEPPPLAERCADYVFPTREYHVIVRATYTKRKQPWWEVVKWKQYGEPEVWVHPDFKIVQPAYDKLMAARKIVAEIPGPGAKAECDRIDQQICELLTAVAQAAMNRKRLHDQARAAQYQAAQAEARAIKAGQAELGDLAIAAYTDDLAALRGEAAGALEDLRRHTQALDQGLPALPH